MPRTNKAFMQRHATYFLAYQMVMVTLLVGYLTYLGFHSMSESAAPAPNLTPRSNFGPVPPSKECADKFRLATLLAMFFSFTAADQWLAHHWILASFKILILLSSALVTVFSYTAGDEPESPLIYLAKFIYSTWSLIDVIMWIVGGVYGIHGCGGGYGG
ncbi:hypothetical protein ONS96_000607 [Cadophora gregata f. sp. sojae]|nr:hypothetical protein ONS96_000607 [Cadophora gregata f. sp. sojae]